MNIVLTAYFNSKIDTQRGVFWDADSSNVETLRRSVKKHGQQLIIFSDCLEGDDVIKHMPERSPYHERWHVYLDYLKASKQVEFVFMVDATDVEMLYNPFGAMIKHRLYVGDEDQKLGTPWMLDNHPEHFLQDFFRGKKKRLLNIGILGGHRDIVIRLLTDYTEYLAAYKNSGDTDMGLFNYLLYLKYKGTVTHGSPINTKFKAYDYDNKNCYWRHK